MINAEMKQDNQDKLYADNLKQEVEEELDSFPIIVNEAQDNNVSVIETDNKLIK